MPDSRYTVTSCSSERGGWWVVTRLRDGKVVFEYRDPRMCLRWIKTWGDERA